jgi:hypothetical protein
MSLHHLLTHLPHEELQGLAKEFGVSTMSPSKNNLINAVSARYRDSQFMKVLFDELSHEAKGLLGAILFLCRHDGENITMPLPMLETWSTDTLYIAHLKECALRGFLFQVDRHECKATLPQEVRTLLIELFRMEVGECALQRTIPFSDVCFNEAGLESIFHLLCVLRHYPAKRTLKGEIHRKTYERWKERFKISSPTMNELLFAFSFCEQQGLIELKGERYGVSGKVASWLNKGNRTLREEWFSYLWRTRVFRNKDFQKFCAMIRLLHESHNLPNAVGVFNTKDIEDLYQKAGFMHHASDTRNRSAFQEMLHWFLFFGVLRTDDYENIRSFSLTKEGHDYLCKGIVEDVPVPEREACLIQPTFQLLAPPSCDYRVLWDLDTIAEFQRHDIMSEFLITQDSILFALRSDWTASSLDAFLLSITHNRIPDNVAYSVKEWCEKFGQVTFHRVMLLECKSRQLAEEITHIPGLKEVLGDRIGDRYFAVNDTEARDVYQKLMDSGYEPAIVKKTHTDL